MPVTLSTSKSIDTEAWIALMASVGFGRASDYTAEKVLRSINAYPFIAHAYTEKGQLVGYISAFSDHAFSTFVGELVVQPLFQGRGIGKQLLAAVETYAAGVPIYVNPLKNSEQFFLRQGFRLSDGNTPTLFKVTGK